MAPIQVYAAGPDKCAPDLFPGGVAMSRLRTLLAFWLIPYGASTWQRFAYALVVVPTAIGSLPLALAGRSEAAARYQRDLASRLVGTPADEPPRRPTDPAVLAISVGIAAVGVACWLLLWRFSYAILPVPLVASCLALVVAGRAPARLRRRPARGSLGLPVGAPTLRWMGARVGVHAVAVVVVGLVCWTLLSYLAFFALANLGFPFRLAVWINESASGGPPGPWALWSTLHRVPHAGSIWAARYPTSDGGPTLAGAWAYHAAAFVVTIFPLLAWMLRGLTRLQSRLTETLLGSPRSVPAEPGAAGQTATRPAEARTPGMDRSSSTDSRVWF
jgi:hypothetical protein